MNCGQKIILEEVVVTNMKLICTNFQALTQLMMEFQGTFNIVE
jgi:hypothetical protein